MTPQPPKQPQNPLVFRQLKVSDNERNRLRDAIYQDFLSAQSNHDARMERFTRYWRMWRSLATSGNPQHLQVPMLKWTTLSHWSRVMQALLGDDAEIIAKPTSEGDDEHIAAKVGKYMTWRVFEYMRAVPTFATWTFRSCLFGRAHCFMPYEQDYFWQRMKPGVPDSDREVMYYDGPKLYPLWPSEIILPAQDGARTVGEFDWKIRRRRITPQDLLDGERRGQFQGIRDNWELIWRASQQRMERNYTWDWEKISADEAEGVSYANVLGTRNSLEMWEWYGKWRFLKGNQDGTVKNISRRKPFEDDVVVSLLPLVGNLIVGIQDLRDLYPRMKRRDPFVDLGLIEDGSYWGPGLGEMIERLQDKATANYALFERAGKFSVGPLIFYRPSAGSLDETFVYSPDTLIATEDPQGVNVVSLKSDSEFSEKNMQALETFAEKVSGDNDQSLGQSIDRPNAPRTAAGQALLAQGANTRIELDFSILRDYLSVFLEQLYELDREFAGPQVFFRVTGDDAQQFETQPGGFGVMTPADREHGFDFQLKFATTVWSKEAKKAETLQLYGLAMQNPIVQQNPRALWLLLNKIWKAIGDGNLQEIIPCPPDPGTPKDPKDEWSMILKGDDVEVNPLDDDDAHMLDHRKRLDWEQDQIDDRRDPRSEKAMKLHIIAHERQKRHKLILAQLAQQAMQQIQAMQQPQPAQPGAPGPAAQPPATVGPAVAPPMPLVPPDNPAGGAPPVTQ